MTFIMYAIIGPNKSKNLHAVAQLTKIKNMYVALLHYNMLCLTFRSKL